MSDELPNLYNSKTAAKFLKDYGYSFDQYELARMRKHGAGPTYQKVGSSVIYTEASLIKWVLADKASEDAS
jgi:hypothetical protein